MHSKIKTRTYLMRALLGVFLTLMGCTASNDKEAAKYSDALIIVVDANEVHYDKLGGFDKVHYIVKKEYPASSVLDEISQKLIDKGWKPLSEDYLNPGSPSSHVRGWTDFTDSQKKPTKKVYQWLAQWENNNHDILLCSLRYTYPRKWAKGLKYATSIYCVYSFKNGN